MSLLELIAAADARGLAASGTACLDRCLPQPAAGAEPDPLRPLWAGCADPRDWADRLAEARAALDGLSDPQEGAQETVLRIRTLLAEAPAERAGEELRTWADACSVLALDIHCGHDAVGADATELVGRCRAGDPEGAGPLLSGEATRQVRILELLAETGDAAPAGGGLRQVRDVSTEGRRVLRAAVSRRARARG
ncbi:hypothetical protein [Streptomyces sp. NBC_01013]|uniref:hypothetical protein n=1 Tax=Streptomyces sp. NBC_01013 TaxID=2903718 RepID=UPI00386EFC3B|nr:hypothetical protein OG538_13530 [Streptomyces sp. NBC_01013]